MLVLGTGNRSRPFRWAWTSFVLFGISSALWAADPAAGSDWARFLGPTGDGKSPETGIVKTWPKEGPPLLWQAPVGEGYAAPSIASGRLYVFDRRGNKARLTSMNARTGDEVWRSEYPTAYEDLYQFSDGPRAVPVIDGDRVYTFGAEGRLRCLAVKDGALLWEVDTAAVFGVVQNFFGAGSVPVVEGDLLIAAIGGSPADTPGIHSGEVVGAGSGIVAFDKRTGTVRYRVGDELASYSSPTFATVGKRRWGFLFARGGLLGFHPAKGTVDFHFPFRAKKLESVNASNPVVVGDTVFITESYGPGSAVLRFRPGGYEVVRQEKSPRDQSMSAHFMTPIYHEGFLYGSSGQSSAEAELRAVAYESGEVKWSEPGLGRTTLLFVDGHLVVLTERGRLLLVEATPKQYRVRADATPPGPEGPLLRYPAWSSPVLSHGVLYLRGKNRLAAFDLAPGS
jgi:outer membrane protein assembly factor BamB